MELVGTFSPSLPFPDRQTPRQGRRHALDLSRPNGQNTKWYSIPFAASERGSKKPKNNDGIHIRSRKSQVTRCLLIQIRVVVSEIAASAEWT